jgi:DNA polymerase III epsilon subunit-like protein
MRPEEIYVSTDVETDGPIPGPHSLLSLASAAYRADGTEVGVFSATLQPLEGATPDPDTLAWWKGQPEAWDAATRDPRPPAEVMREYAAWVRALPGAPVFVAYPAAFDFMWVHWYLVRFAGGDPFGHSALDVRSFAMAVLRRSYRQSGKDRMPRHWFAPELPHTHQALDDARAQGALFCAMLRENRSAAAPDAAGGG